MKIFSSLILSIIFILNPKLSIAQSSSEAFNRFISSSPEAQAAIKQAKETEQIDAGCMYSAKESHIGVTITRDGNIYNWTMGENDKKEQKKLVANDKDLTDKLFKLKDTNGFENASLDYEIDGTSYCYVRTKSGSSSKQIIWPRNGLMSGGRTVPQSAKELFEATINTAALAMGLGKVKPKE